MGGIAAKQRRRLERQPLQKQPSTNQNPKKASLSKVVRSLKGTKLRGSIVSQERPAAVQNKIQKPKHLKRKLESIDKGETLLSDNERVRLFNQIQELERIKKHRPVSTQVPNEKHDLDGVAIKKHRSVSSKVPNEKHDLDGITPVFDISNEESKEDFKSLQIQRPQSVSTANAQVAKIEIAISNGSTTEDVISNHNSTCEDGDSDDDDDDDGHFATGNTRQRGKRIRRRGRKDASDVAVTGDAHGSDIGDDVNSANDNSQNTNAKPIPGAVSERAILTGSNVDSVVSNDDDMAVNRNDKNTLRRCIGRKPVTDFVIGQCYSGKVVYAKSYGVFFDIGCHSDAFCHVSLLSDEYIESPIDTFPIGHTIDNAIRVISIDRRKKRLTVSLQHPSRDVHILHGANISTAGFDDQKQKNRTPPATTVIGNSGLPVIAVSSEVTSTHIRAETGNESTVPRQNIDNETATSSSFNENLNSSVSAEQHKRSRKLARRAQRRVDRVASTVATEIVTL
jgi:predicted RNA-binding protein with RPS1 domain